MSSGKLTRFIAIGATAIAIAGGAYGILTATAGKGSGTATTATSAAATSGRPALGGRGSNARSGPAAGGNLRHGRQRAHIELHTLDISGPEGDRQDGVLDDISQGHNPYLGECH